MPRAPTTTILETLQGGARLARRAGLGRLVDTAGIAQLDHRARKGRVGSGEEAILGVLLGELEIRRDWVVDIAACDGVTNSNSLALYSTGWSGLAVEGSGASFAWLSHVYRGHPDVHLARLWVTPTNAVDLLRAYGVPREFGLLNLDIDGYDHFVLGALLEAYRPVVICAEINEMFAPPIKFTVRYDPEYAWAGDRFFGQSLAKLDELGQAHGYAIAEVYYNNAFLVRTDRLRRDPLSPAEAYRSGYLDRADRLERFPWNAEVESIHSLDLDGKLAFIRSLFAAYEGRYDLST